MQNQALAVETINFVPHKPIEKEKKEKFNILEILIILSAIGIIVFLVLLAINPNKEGAEARNNQRSADISTILTYVSSYVNDVHTIPEEIPNTKTCVEYMNEICKTGPYDCTDLVDMSFLNSVNSSGEQQLVTMPQDPKHISINGTGYFIFTDGKGEVTVCAPYAERNQEISFSKYMY